MTSNIPTEKFRSADPKLMRLDATRRLAEKLLAQKSVAPQATGPGLAAGQHAPSLVHSPIPTSPHGGLVTPSPSRPRASSLKRTAAPKPTLSQSVQNLLEKAAGFRAKLENIADWHPQHAPLTGLIEKMTNEAERLNGGPIVGYELDTPVKKCRIASTSPEVTCYDPDEPATSQKASPQMQSGSGKSSSAASSSGLAAEPSAAQPSSPAPSDAGSETSAKSESAASVLAMLQHCCSKAGFSNIQEALEAATSPHGPVSPQLVSPQLTPQLFPELMPDGS